MITSSLQTRCYQYIADYISASGGVAPSYTEIRRHLGLKSKSHVNRLVTQLVDRGKIRRIPNRARALEVVHKGSTGIPLPPGRKPMLRIGPAQYFKFDDETKTFVQLRGLFKGK